MLLLALLTFGCKEKHSITNGGWTFTDPNSLFYLAEPVPTMLSTNGIHLVTPAGTFQPYADGKWKRISWRAPMPDARRQWVMMTLGTCTEEIKQRGFYRTDELDVQTKSWRDTQLGGTPVGWVYAYKMKDSKEIGCWIAPEKFKDIDWGKF